MAQGKDLDVSLKAKEVWIEMNSDFLLKLSRT